MDLWTPSVFPRSGLYNWDRRIWQLAESHTGFLTHGVSGYTDNARAKLLGLQHKSHWLQPPSHHGISLPSSCRIMTKTNKKQIHLKFSLINE